MNLLKRWLVIMLAVYVAAWLVPGIQVSSGGWTAYAIMAAVLALLNAILLPILKTLSCGLIVLSLGLFSLVLNAAVFLLSSNISQTLFGAGYQVDGWLAAFLGSLIVSIATMFFANDRSSKRDRKDD